MKNLPEWLIRLSLIIVSTGFALIIAFLLAPKFLTQNRAKFANIDMGEIEFMVGNGDLFVAQWGSIAPPDNPYEVLSRHHLAWDADGFRVPQFPSETYEIIALGDSYTEAANVAYPWPDIVARESGRAVRNLGYRGYGPQELAQVMEEYSSRDNPKVVLVSFFGGNDLSNAGSFEERGGQLGLPEIVHDTVTVFNASGEPWNSNQEFYQYPVELDFEGQREPIAFFNSYTSWLTVLQDDLRASVELAAIRQSWIDIRETTSEDTCIIIAYFPSKSHIYLPYVIDEDRATIVDGQSQRLLDETNFRIKRNFDNPPTHDDLLERRNNIAIVLSEVAAEENLHFIDLAPYFDEAAAQGQILYYRYDTHWNQAGHDLAGQKIANYMKNYCESN